MKKFLSLVIICFLFCLTIGYYNLNASEIKNYSPSFKNSEFFSYTNTYDYIPDYGKDEARYDFTTHDSSKPISSEPLITFFTHGLDGSAKHWSNDGENGNFSFTYSNNSLITKLAKMIDCNVYHVEFISQVDMRIYDITSQVYDGIAKGTGLVKYKNFKDQNLSIDNISDISKHSIFVFSLFEDGKDDTNNTNDYLYSQLNYAISKVVYDYMQLNHEILPKMNLIGHSRGGIINMQYALDHPDLVESIYSLATPYAGSTTATLDLEIFNAKISGSATSSNEIISKDVYGKYMERWNNNYETLYKNIKVMALGGYTTIDNLVRQLTSDTTKNYFISNLKMNQAFVETGLPIALNLVEAAMVTLYPVLHRIPAYNIAESILKTVTECLSNYDIEHVNVLIAFLQIVLNEIDFSYYPFIVWQNDTLVDLGSQLGYEGVNPTKNEMYKGFNIITKCFMEGNYDMSVLSTNLPSVGHNLEARDKELGDYILRDINVGFVNDYIYTYKDEGVFIESYIGDADAMEISIPSKLGDENIVGIGEYAFANLPNLKEIKIPDTIKYIDKYAFSNDVNLKNVNISGSNLTEIGEYAFNNCSSLKELYIGSVKKISNDAFRYSGIEYISPLTSRYLWKNNMLISLENKSVIYANPNESDFIIPNDVKMISMDVFESHKNISSIDLGNVEYIGANCFLNSSLETIIGGNNLSEIESFAFYNTPYLNNNAEEFVILGNSLIDYNGISDVLVIPEEITNISINSLNENVKKVILPTSLLSISNHSFCGYFNLKNVLLTSTKVPYLGGKVFNLDTNIYVREDMYPLFTQEDLYNNSFFHYIDNIKLLEIDVTFKDVNGYVLGTTIEYYGSTLDNIIEPNEIDGKDFNYFIDQNTNIVNINSVLNSYEDYILRPYYTDTIYSIVIDSENNNVTLSDLSIVDIPGYEFVGWFDQKEGGTQILDINEYILSNYNSGPLYIYRRYEIIKYSLEVDLKINDTDEKEIMEFTVESPISLSELNKLYPRKFGYVFDYWKNENTGKKFTSTEQIYEDIKVEAVWIGYTQHVKASTTIGNEICIIDFSIINDLSEYTFYIGERIRAVSFIGKGTTIINMNIIVYKRSKDLIIGLDSISISPKKATKDVGTTAIYCDMQSDFELYIYSKGDCTISGGSGADGIDNSQDGKIGGYGIEAPKVSFWSYEEGSSITVTGGRGGNGIAGINGVDGKDGKINPNGSVLNPTKGQDGEDGTDGTNGGNGGSGQLAIKVAKEDGIIIEKDMSYTFVGGTGGTGGNGGAGGNGGSGANDTSANIINGVGDPGDGGNAGNGGNGGNGGDGADATNAISVDSLGGSGGYGGSKGTAGSKGSGGDAGTIGADGTNGDSGQDGEDGNSGQNGEDGQKGAAGKTIKSKKLKQKPKIYLFTKEFIYKDINIYYIYANDFKQFVNQYNQGQYFNYAIEDVVSLNNGLLFNTNRLRCSYIENQYLVLSAKRSGAGTAYLEMTFDSYINSISFDIGLWSANEGLSKENSNILFQYQNGDGDWITLYNFINDDLNIKDNMNTYDFNLSLLDTCSIRFIVTTTQATGSSNKGRVVLENFIFNI